MLDSSLVLQAARGWSQLQPLQCWGQEHTGPRVGLPTSGPLPTVALCPHTVVCTSCGQRHPELPPLMGTPRGADAAVLRGPTSVPLPVLVLYQGAQCLHVIHVDGLWVTR